MTTAALLGEPPPPAALSRRAWWLIAAAHLPLLVVPALVTTLSASATSATGSTATTVLAVLAVLAAVAVGALQVRHAHAYARGTRPCRWPWTLMALAVLVYLPLVWLSPSWMLTQWAFVASLVMLLPARIGWVLGVVIVLGSEAVLTTLSVQQYRLGAAIMVWSAIYNLAVAGLGPVALLVAPRLARVLDDLTAARAELAEAAVAQDRLRISRDLHDLLGQSLSAVALKGELAMRLWASDQPTARAEIESLTTVARRALRDLSTVVFDRHPTSLHDELDAAERLLGAAGIHTEIDVAFPTVGGPVSVQDDALGWVLREAVTNILRHSAATDTVIRGGRRDGRIRFEIVNDGAGGDRPGSASPGSGLTGLADRLAPLGGASSVERLPEGWFRLAIDLPEELP